MNCTRRKSMLPAAIFAAAGFVSASSLAEENPPSMVNPNARYGFGLTGGVFVDGGGEDFATAVFTNGSSESITTADGFGFNIGGRYRPQDSRVDLSATVGYKLDEVSAANGSMSMSRTVLDLHLDYFLNDSFWIGFGPVMHRGVKFKGGGWVPDIVLDDASGVNFRIGWKAFALTHTAMDYSVLGVNFDASSTGLLVQGRF